MVKVVIKDKETTCLIVLKKNRMELFNVAVNEKDELVLDANVTKEAPNIEIQVKHILKVKMPSELFNFLSNKSF